MISALGLYTVGGIASFTGHPTLAAVVYAAGISMCALALWLSRGADSGDDPPRGGEEPSDERPPGDPEQPEFDFARFEREFRAYSDSAREPAIR